MERPILTRSTCVVKNYVLTIYSLLLTGIALCATLANVVAGFHAVPCVSLESLRPKLSISIIIIIVVIIIVSVSLSAETEIHTHFAIATLFNQSWWMMNNLFAHWYHTGSTIYHTTVLGYLCSAMVG